MALISCPECGQSISDVAVCCPHCGMQRQASLVPFATRSAKPVEQKGRVSGGLVVIVLVCLGLWIWHQAGIAEPPSVVEPATVDQQPSASLSTSKQQAIEPVQAEPAQASVPASEPETPASDPQPDVDVSTQPVQGLFSAVAITNTIALAASSPYPTAVPTQNCWRGINEPSAGETLAERASDCAVWDMIGYIQNEMAREAGGQGDRFFDGMGTEGRIIQGLRIYAGLSPDEATRSYGWLKLTLEPVVRQSLKGSTGA